METQIPNYLDVLVSNSKNAFCETLHNPSLWSEGMIKRTLERSGGTTFNITDVQTIVKDYLTVLSETIRRGDNL